MKQLNVMSGSEERDFYDRNYWRAVIDFDTDAIASELRSAKFI